MIRDNRDEHEHDPLDVADALMLLDDGEVSFAECPSCRRIVCTCDDFGQEPERWRSYRHARRAVREDRS